MRNYPRKPKKKKIPNQKMRGQKTKIKRLLIVKQRLKTRNDKQKFF